MVEPRNQPPDNAGLPIYHDGVWGPWINLTENHLTGVDEVSHVSCRIHTHYNNYSTTQISDVTESTIKIIDRTEMSFKTPQTDSTPDSEDQSQEKEVLSDSTASQHASNWYRSITCLFGLLLIVLSE